MQLACQIITSMGSGTITEFPNEICGGAAVATESFTNNIGRDKF